MSQTKAELINAKGNAAFDTNTLFVDATNNRVGIGTTAPAYNTHIKQSGANSYSLALESNADDSRFVVGNVSSTWRVAATYGTTGSFQPITFFTSDLERARLDISGRLLVGTSSVSGNSDAQTAFVQAMGNSGGSFQGGRVNLSRAEFSANITAGEQLGGIYFSDAQSGTYGVIECVADGTGGTNDFPGRLVFSTTADGAASPTERMRIANNGTVNIFTGVSNSVGWQFNSGSTVITSGAWSSGAGTNAVKWNSSSGLLTWDSSSRLVKKNINDCLYGIETIKQLQSRIYTRVDSGELEIGFIADEVQAVIPELVPTGPKSAITGNADDTEEIPISVNYDKLTAVLTKALQEAIAKIETLEAKVTALESA